MSCVSFRRNAEAWNEASLNSVSHVTEACDAVTTTRKFELKEASFAEVICRGPSVAGYRLELKVEILRTGPKRVAFPNHDIPMSDILSSDSRFTVDVGSGPGALLRGIFGWIYRKNLERAVPLLVQEIEAAAGPKP